MADKTGGPDSADPKAILRDLQQLALVAQRLGIDLQKTAAMGQTVAGQRGSSTSSIREQHASQMPGGGTGYQNATHMAQVGGSIAMQRPLQRIIDNDNYKKFEATWKSGVAPGSWFYKDKIIRPLVPPPPGHPSYSPGYIPPHKYNEPSGPSSPWSPTPKGAVPGKSSKDFGAAMNRQFNTRFTTIHGLMEVYGALTDPVDESRGETRLTKIGDAVSRTARVAAFGEAVSAGLVAKEAYAASRVVGASRTSSAWRAAKTAGPAAAATAAAFVAINEVQGVFDFNKEWNRTKLQLGAAKEGWSPRLRPDLKPANWKPQVSADAALMFNKAAQRGSDMFYIDPETGERKERGFFGKLKANLRRARPFFWFPFLGNAEDIKAEKEWRIKEANRAHEDATKKVEVMDWNSAIRDVEKARKMIVAEEAMPFFWKHPEKFLRNMEASRIAGRNWARSLQPRAPERTGD